MIVRRFSAEACANGIENVSSSRTDLVKGARIPIAKDTSFMRVRTIPRPDIDQTRSIRSSVRV